MSETAEQFLKRITEPGVLLWPKDGEKLNALVNALTCAARDARAAAIEEAAVEAERERVMFLDKECLRPIKVITAVRAQSRKEIAAAIRGLACP